MNEQQIWLTDGNNKSYDANENSSGKFVLSMFLIYINSCSKFVQGLHL